MSAPNRSPDGEVQPVSVVAAADDSRQSMVPGHCEFVTVTARATDANDWIRLPHGRVGQRIRGYSVVAHEMRTPPNSNVKINNVDSDGTGEAAIPAAHHWEVQFVNAIVGWRLMAWTNLGAVITAIVPD